MMYTATFKGLKLPQGEKQLKVPRQLNVTCQVQVFEDATPRGTTYKARIIGGGRLDVRAKTPDTAKVLTEGLFQERISEWQEVA